MSADKILGIVVAVISGLNIWFFGHNRRRKNDLDFRELFLSAREGVNKLQMQTLKSLEEGLNRREKALAEKETCLQLDAKNRPVCLCTAKVEPGDGVVDDSLDCEIHTENLKRVPGCNKMANCWAYDLAYDFLSFVSELKENESPIEEARLYVIFTEDQYEYDNPELIQAEGR